MMVRIPVANGHDRVRMQRPAQRPLRKVRAGSAPPPVPFDWPAAEPLRDEEFDRAVERAYSRALRAAYNNGQEHAERTAYIQGWRWGALFGTTLGVTLAGAALALARQAGVWLP